MSRADVELMRAAYERASRGDFSVFAEVSTEDFEFVTTADAPDAGTYRGEEAFRWLEDWTGAFDGLTIEATEILDAGDKVFVGVFQRGRPRGGKVPVEGRWWQVATVRGGRVARSEIYSDRDSALEAAGLSE